MTVMEMTQRELTEAIATGLSSVVNRIDSRVNALAESFSRRLDALERQAGPVGNPYEKETAFVREMYAGSDSDSKDALIRELMGRFPTPCARDRYCKCSPDCQATYRLRDRAEKLGVKL